MKDLISDDLVINDRKYRFDYEQQPTRNVITIYSEQSTEQDSANIKRLGQLLGKELRVYIDPNSPQRLFIQKIDSEGKPQSVSVNELKIIVANCLAKF
jgi:hypothetical protein